MTSRSLQSKFILLWFNYTFTPLLKIPLSQKTPTAHKIPLITQESTDLNVGNYNDIESIQLCQGSKAISFLLTKTSVKRNFSPFFLFQDDIWLSPSPSDAPVKLRLSTEPPSEDCFFFFLSFQLRDGKKWEGERERKEKGTMRRRSKRKNNVFLKLWTAKEERVFFRVVER